MSNYFEEPMKIGEDFHIYIEYDDLIDITGYKHYFTLRYTLEGSPVLSVSSTVGDHPLDSVENRKAGIAISNTLTSQLQRGRFYWELQVETPDNPGNKITLSPPPEDFRDMLRVVP